MASYHNHDEPRALARWSRDHNTMFYRVLLGIIIIILLEISCDSRDSRQDSKDSGKIPRFQRDSWSCRRDSESCRTPRNNFKGLVQEDLSCHRWSPQNGSPRTICGKLCCYGWSPRTKHGCHRWSPRTICGAVSGPPLPQMVPLKLSLEMMSRGSYEVNLANMVRVITIIIYFSLCIASCSS